MTGSQARVIVISSGDWVWETVRRLQHVAGIELAGVVMTPAYRPLPFWRRLRRAFRNHGMFAPIKLSLRRLRSARPSDPAAPASVDRGAVPVVMVPDIRAPEAIDVIRELAPDVGILDGSSIIPPAIFSIPRLGMINIHCGQLPAYRGAPPVFWELFNGERKVGVTIHRVAADVDAGSILAQRVFPLDTEPTGDAEEYARSVWRGQLRPAALDLLAGCLPSVISGTATELQPAAEPGPVYRHPTHRQRRELRRRVAARRGR